MRRLYLARSEKGVRGVPLAGDAVERCVGRRVGGAVGAEVKAVARRRLGGELGGMVYPSEEQNR